MKMKDKTITDMLQDLEDTGVVNIGKVNSIKERLADMGYKDLEFLNPIMYTNELTKVNLETICNGLTTILNKSQDLECFVETDLTKMFNSLFTTYDSLDKLILEKEKLLKGLNLNLEELTKLKLNLVDESEIKVVDVEELFTGDNLIRLSTILDNEEILNYENLNPGNRLIALLFFKQSCLTNIEVSQWSYNDFVNIDLLIKNFKESITEHKAKTRELLTSWLTTGAVSESEHKCLNSVYELLSDAETVEDKINQLFSMIITVTTNNED